MYNSPRNMKRHEVQWRTGLSCTEIYRRMAQGTFPKQYKIGVRAVAWRSDQVDAWVMERVKAAAGAQP